MHFMCSYHQFIGSFPSVHISHLYIVQAAPDSYFLISCKVYLYVLLFHLNFEGTFVQWLEGSLHSGPKNKPRNHSVRRSLSVSLSPPMFRVFNKCFLDKALQLALTFGFPRGHRNGIQGRNWSSVSESSVSSISSGLGLVLSSYRAD